MFVESISAKILSFEFASGRRSAFDDGAEKELMSAS